jgi:small redox-active disulfide protein 2
MACWQPEAGDRKEPSMKAMKVLGTGCPNCKKLAETMEAAAQALGVAYEMEKVTDVDQIMSFGVVRTPALVIDGKVVLSGRVPSVDEAKGLLA